MQHPTLQSRSHSHDHHSHSHDDHSHGLFHHHHHHGPSDAAYLTSRDRRNPGVRITRLGLATNLVIAAVKIVGGYALGSQALMADGYHALTDIVSDIMTLGTVSVSTKPPSERFPNGYGKMESLGSLSVSGLLLSGGLFMGVSSATALVGMAFPELSHMIEHIGVLGHVHAHSHGAGIGDSAVPSLHAAWLAVGSIMVKESLYRATMKVAKELRSSVLSSNAVHHRIDSLTSLVALATIAGANVLPSAAWLDPSGCLLISLMVVKAGYDNTRLSLLELADAAVDEDIRSAVSEAAAASLHTMPAALQDAIGPSVQQGPRVARVSGTKAGQGYLMVLTLVVPDGWTVAQTRMVENHVRLVVGGKVKGLKKLDIRFVPLSAVLSDEQELDRQLHTEEFIDPDAAPLHQHNQPLEQQQQAGGERACDLRAASPEKGLRTGSSTAIQSEAAPKSIRRQR